MTDPGLIVAMWSGPRNLSTALMRSFAQRDDCYVWDEPFYASYLVRTGAAHPMRAEVIEAGIIDADEVAARCLEPPVGAKQVFYQKHMTQHMVEGVPGAWIADVTNAFLIRAPERVLASYAKKYEDVAAADIGFRKQRELFEQTADRLGTPPPVIDAEDVRADPEGHLRALCAALGITFDAAMLSWPPGPRPEDGVWGRHWYDGLWKSTGFAPPGPAPEPLPDALARIADDVRADYAFMARHKLTPQR